MSESSALHPPEDLCGHIACLREEIQGVRREMQEVRREMQELRHEIGPQSSAVHRCSGNDYEILLKRSDSRFFLTITPGKALSNVPL